MSIQIFFEKVSETHLYMKICLVKRYFF